MFILMYRGDRASGGDGAWLSKAGSVSEAGAVLRGTL